MKCYKIEPIQISNPATDRLSCAVWQSLQESPTDKADHCARHLLCCCPKNGSKGKVEACDEEVHKQEVGARNDSLSTHPLFTDFFITRWLGTLACKELVK